MYPTKSMMDYMNEMNRLFPQNMDNDAFHSPLTPHTPLHQSMARSSSSTDTSPDTFPDITVPRYSNKNLQRERQRDYGMYMRPDQFESHENFEFTSRDQIQDMRDIPFSQQIQETPFVMRRQRPIVGRKMTADQIPKINEETNVWSEEFFQTPPNNFLEQKLNQSCFYELFPAENKEFELKTPQKSPNMFTTPPKMMHLGTGNMSSKMTNTPMSSMSARMMNMSPHTAPCLTNMSPTDISPPRYIPPYSPRLSAFREPFVGTNTFHPNTASKMCTFCRKNGETPLVYMTHAVKEKVGNKNIVRCPILRSHVCATCGATGDNAHTITYCPILRSSNNGQPLQSTTITLKNTRIKSNGRRRY